MQYEVQIVISARSLEMFNLIMLYTFGMRKLVNISSWDEIEMWTVCGLTGDLLQISLLDSEGLDWLGSLLW